MTLDPDTFFEWMNELVSFLNDPIVDLKVVLIVLTVMIAFFVASFVVQKLMPLVIKWSSAEKRKNDEKPKRGDEPEATVEWFVGDDGELIEREVQR